MPYELNNVEVVMIPVNEIIPYWRNPRRNDKTVDALCETIPVHGFNVPIVVDRNNVVVKGHARLRAAKRLGMEQVPCIVSDASEDVIKADRIADNKIQELSAWDFGKLNVELERHGTPIFDKLFKKENLPYADNRDFEAPKFMPVGINAYDFEDEQGQEVDMPATPTVMPSNEPVYSAGETGAAEYSPVVGGYDAPQSVPSGAQHQPQPQTGPRQCKTLCPYCGKIVMVTV